MPNPQSGQSKTAIDPMALGQPTVTVLPHTREGGRLIRQGRDSQNDKLADPTKSYE